MEKRSWVAPVLLLAGLCALNVWATMDLVLVVTGDDKGREPMEWLRAIALGASAVLLAAGLLVGRLRGKAPQGRVIRWFTVTLGVLGVFALGMAAVYEVVPTGGDAVLGATFLFTQRMLLTGGVLLLASAASRGLRARLAFPLTAATAIAMLLFVPIGTALGVVWLVGVEPKERELP